MNASVNHPGVFLIELLTGARFLWAMIVHQNLWFLGPGVALLLSPVVANFGWENRVVRALAWVPLLAAVALLAFIGWQVIWPR